MENLSRIYLDNAATSFPKPESVYAAVEVYNRQLGTAVGRGTSRDSMTVQSTVDRCRKRAADLIGAESSDRIVFTFNGTDSLNLAIHGLLAPGDHVVTTVIEHNSVLRPLNELESRIGLEVTHIQADETGLIDPVEFQRAIQPNTKMFALIHASNVTGTLQPIEAVGEIAREAGITFLLDAAQSIGHTPINLDQLPVDLLACPGHKGLLGPLGTGLLYIRPGLEQQLNNVRQGGTGSESENPNQPETLPDKFESGNHNAPGLFGLEAGLKHLSEVGIDSIQSHEQQLLNQMFSGLAGLPGLKVYGPNDAEKQVGVASISVEGWEPQVLASLLDEQFQIQTRAGLHCAPGVHRAIGSFAVGGTVRFSFGPFTTADDIDAAVTALKEISGTV